MRSASPLRSRHDQHSHHQCRRRFCTTLTCPVLTLGCYRSTTTARRALRRCTWPNRWSRQVLSSVRWLWVLRRYVEASSFCARRPELQRALRGRLSVSCGVADRFPSAFFPSAHLTDGCRIAWNYLHRPCTPTRQDDDDDCRARRFRQRSLRSALAAAYVPLRSLTPAVTAAQIFGNGAEEYCQRYGSTWEDVSAIGGLIRLGASLGSPAQAPDSRQRPRTTSTASTTPTRSSAMP